MDIGFIGTGTMGNPMARSLNLNPPKEGVRLAP